MDLKADWREEKEETSVWWNVTLDVGKGISWEGVGGSCERAEEVVKGGGEGRW